MDFSIRTLDEAAGQPGQFPAGLFWLHRGEDAPLPRVQTLLAVAAAKGVEAALVRIENFDEAVRDSIRLIDGLDTTGLSTFAQERRRWSPAPRPVGRRAWPVVRLNALPVAEAPTVCRRVVCSIGGTTEVRAAVEKVGVEVLVARTRAGVLAFGADADVRKALVCHKITEFDLHTIEARRLRYESAERGLLREALTRAVIRGRRVEAIIAAAPICFPPQIHLRPNGRSSAGSWGGLRVLCRTVRICAGARASVRASIGQMTAYGS
jgi:hypothetical protein